MPNRGRSILYIAASVFFTLIIAQSISNGQNEIQIWDTSSPFTSIQDRAKWTTLSTEVELQGDIVLENKHFLAVFSSENGKVIIYSKSGEKKAEIAPLHWQKEGGNIAACDIMKSSDSGSSIKVHFSFEGRDSSAIFSFSRDQVIQVKSVEDMDGVGIISPMEFAIVPSFISDDLIFNPADYQAETLHIPAENLLLGLSEGEDSMLVLTWPDGNQRVRLAADGNQLFGSIDFENAGKSLYLAILEASGIWHREKLERSYLEKDIAIDWKRPFPAKWITQLLEDRVKTTYTFKDYKKERFWRAGLGRYTYPVWFEKEKAFFRLGKRIPPKGESLIYCLERKETPDSISTPVDILQKTLDKGTYEKVIDSEGRQNRSSNPGNYDAATCAITDKIKAIFEAGEETQSKEDIKRGTEDMTYFMKIERGRAEEYESFANEMIEFLEQAKKDKPELSEYLDGLTEITKEIINVYEHEKDNIGSAKYSKKLSEETQALAKSSDPGNLEAFLKLKGRWTSMGGAVEDVNRALNTTTRKLFQQAGYGCVTQVEAVEVAQEIRRRIIKCLRRPSPYEIWADY